MGYNGAYIKVKKENKEIIKKQVFRKLCLRKENKRSEQFEERKKKIEILFGLFVELQKNDLGNLHIAFFFREKTIVEDVPTKKT